MESGDAILGIFCKEPGAGTVKTRLADATSPEFAATVAAAFLEDTLDRFASMPVARMIVYAPAGSSDYFARLSRGRYGLVAQSEGDLGSRLRAFFAYARQRGFRRIAAMGTDSPTLPIEYVERAFDLLESHDCVIGPAFDGGYCLLGTAGENLDLFDDIPWSTPSVLEATCRRIEELRCSLALLPPWYDVDTLPDWEMLCGHVVAMRRTGIDPGVPRVEALIKRQT